MSEGYKPPYHLTDEMVGLIGEISELIGTITAWSSMNMNPQLRRDNRVKTIQASLAIENNSLSVEQVTDIINGKRILGAPAEIHEVKNAFEAYEKLLTFDPYSVDDLLAAHGILMDGLVSESGKFRSSGVGVFSGGKLIHMAPPAEFVRDDITSLLDWLKNDPAHILIKSCIFHYEFEFIHPFRDGNGRMGPIWQTLILSRWKPLFAWLPVETLIRERQEEYYAALQASDQQACGDQTAIFLMTAIRDALLEIHAGQHEELPVADEKIRKLVSAIGNDTLSGNELMLRLGLKNRPNFRQGYLLPAIQDGLIEMTIPDKPSSRNQKYRRCPK